MADAMDSSASAGVPIRVLVNGEAREAMVPPDRVLLDVLRDDFGLTGTKEGCSVGVCGLCSVLVDGRLMTACLLPAVKVDGRSVTTVEGLGGADGGLSPVQQAFIDHGGFQCGICTPGQVVAATALLAENATPSEEEVRDWMTGNLCRCTGYYGIVAAVLAAAGGGDESPRMRPQIEEVVPEPLEPAVAAEHV
jgi:aerobic carbon-monoxide dehydrogenase small subunit